MKIEQLNEGIENRKLSDTLSGMINGISEKCGFELESVGILLKRKDFSCHPSQLPEDMRIGQEHKNKVASGKPKEKKLRVLRIDELPPFFQISGNNPNDWRTIIKIQGDGVFEISTMCFFFLRDGLVENAKWYQWRGIDGVVHEFVIED